MTTINTNASALARQRGNSPWGNATNLPFHFETNASGVAVNTDLATAVQVADVVVLGVIPGGFRMEDALVVRSDAFTASTTASIGFAYTDGVDLSGADAQDAAYFASALATDATGVSRKTGVKAPLTLKKDAYLILTIAGAAHAAVGVMDVIVQGTDLGLAG